MSDRYLNTVWELIVYTENRALLNVSGLYSINKRKHASYDRHWLIMIIIKSNIIALWFVHLQCCDLFCYSEIIQVLSQTGQTGNLTFKSCQGMSSAQVISEVELMGQVWRGEIKAENWCNYNFKLFTQAHACLYLYVYAPVFIRISDFLTFTDVLWLLQNIKAYGEPGTGNTPFLNCWVCYYITWLRHVKQLYLFCKARLHCFVLFF